MNGDLQLTCDLCRGVVTLDWSLEEFTDGLDGKFIFLDEDGEPRLLLDREELVQLQRGER